MRAWPPRHLLMPTLLLLAVGMGLCALPRPVDADSPSDGARSDELGAAEAAFRLLDSPVQEERREGVTALVGLLPGVRARVISSLETASWSLQTQLIEVLTRDGSPGAVRALLDHLMRTDETQAVRIRMNLARDEEASTRLLAMFREDPRAFLALGGAKGSDARGLRRLMDLVSVLRRGEIEAKFLSRKSGSGSTGYYRGQYDLLKDPKLGEAYRQLSLDVVTGIVLNEAVPTPGMYRSGAYRFLRAHHIDEIELIGMAVNAVAEICTPDDEGVIRRLQERLVQVDRKRMLLYERLGQVLGEEGWGKAFEVAHLDWEDALGEYGDVLGCLAIIQPALYDRLVTGFIRELEAYSGSRQPRARMGMIAGLLIRVGRYPEAIDAYESYLAYGYGSVVLSRYNLACAWASYSRLGGASAMERTFRRQRALAELTMCVDAGWSDVRWMNQDRDLDAIRDTDVYRALVKQIDASFRATDEEQAPGRAKAAGSGK